MSYFFLMFCDSVLMLADFKPTDDWFVFIDFMIYSFHTGERDTKKQHQQTLWKLTLAKKKITNQRSHDKWLSTTKQAKNCRRLKHLRAHHDIWKCNVQRWKTLFPVEFCQFRHWFELHEKIKLKYLRILANEPNTLCCQYGRI